jgi:hypothetical protein
MKLLPVLFAITLLFAIALVAADPEGYAQYSSTDLKAKVDAAKPDDHKVRMDRVANWGNHSLLAIRRDGDGEAEVHDTQVDVIFVKSGEGTLILGGTVVERSKAASARRSPPVTSSMFPPKFHTRCWSPSHFPSKS